MKKVYKLENLGCANCAAKMENSLKKLDGVNGASVSFMSARLTIDAEEENLPAILEKAQAIISKIERKCKIVK